MEQSEVQGLPEMWAVIELFGHQTAAGKLSTQVLGAACLIRLDVPEITRLVCRYGSRTDDDRLQKVTTPAHTRFFGVGAIYSINPCSEETARAQLARIGNPPIVQMEVERIKLLKAPPDAVEAAPAPVKDLEANPELFGEGPAEPTGIVCPNCQYSDCEVKEGVICCPECLETFPLERADGDSGAKE